ncbi:MAG: ABC transporter ATP-binding protein [Clostridia bacterium]|nr:ABC transporter ATP-binding protein [Clostridia bacterium]
MKTILTHLRAYRRDCVLAPLFKMLEAIFELFVPLVVAAIIDRGIEGGDRTVVWQMGSILVALGIIGLCCSVTAQYFAARAAVGSAASLRRALFAHIQSLSYTELDQLGTSTLITRMTADVNQVQSGVNLVLRLFLRSPFIVFGSMIMAFTIDVPAALVFVVTIPVLSLVVFGIMCWSIPRFKQVQGALDRVLGSTRENLSGARVIRAFGREAAERDEFDARNSALTALQLKVGRMSALMNPLTYVIVNLAVIALVQVGALRVDDGILTQGQVVALYNYMSQILVELIKLANLIITINKSLACAGRITSVFGVKSSMTVSASPRASGDPTAPAVEFRGVSFAYAGAAEPSLERLNLTVPRGQTIGVIGGTGSGKTTLVNLIPRFYDATDGAVLIDGVDVRDYAPDALRQKIGVVPQKASLFAGTIRDNLLWGAHAGDPTDDAALWQALELAQAKEIIERKEGGLDARVEQNGRNLSGGQRQRLTIARALVGRPEILILDDSASALDYATDAALRQSLRSLTDTTTFIVSQRAASIRHADQIVVLDDGAVVGIGTHDQLLAECPVYAEIYYSQFEKEEK